MSQTSEIVLRQQLATAIGQLFAAGVMSPSGHGTFSVRLPEAERLLLVGSGLAGPPRLEEIALVTFDGEAVSGRLDPGTREIVAMHVGVYRRRPAVGSVRHTHSPHVTTYALAYQPLPCVDEGLLRFGVAGSIPVAEWAPRGSAEAVGCIVEELERHPTTPAVLLGNHGLLAFATDPLRGYPVSSSSSRGGPRSWPSRDGMTSSGRSAARRSGSTAGIAIRCCASWSRGLAGRRAWRR